jgi:hypothetical protein
MKKPDKEQIKNTIKSLPYDVQAAVTKLVESILDESLSRTYQIGDTFSFRDESHWLLTQLWVNHQPLCTLVCIWGDSHKGVSWSFDNIAVDRPDAITEAELRKIMGGYAYDHANFTLVTE